MIEYDVKNALQENGCGICKIIQNNIKKEFWWFEKEGHYDISTLKNISYICPRHTEQIKTLNNKLSASFDIMIKQELMLLYSFKNEHFRNINKRINSNISKGCKFCKDEERIEMHAIKTFITMLEDEDIRVLYKQSDGMCKKHLFETLKTVGKKNNISIFLIEDAISRLENIKEKLNEFFRKTDYRFSSEEKSDEQNAWIEALKFYSLKGNWGV